MQSKKVTPNLKKAIWDHYIGIGLNESICPLCGLYRIYKSQNSGYEAAHIVADKFFDGHELTSLYVFPSCTQCNNECRDLCLLDFLYVRERYGALRSMIWSIYTIYNTLNPGEEWMSWKLLNHLYGKERFAAGGGIVNTRQIYEIARNDQIQRIIKQTTELTAELQKNAKFMQTLLEC
jgi:hypothetical protein